MVRMLNNNRRAVIALAMVVAFVAAVVPMCRMIGCSMGDNGWMPWGHSASVGIYGSCGGTWVTSSTLPAAVPPSATMSLLLVMVAAVLAIATWYQPPVVVQRISVHDSDPPPPPEDPRGERLRI